MTNDLFRNALGHAMQGAGVAAPNDELDAAAAEIALRYAAPLRAYHNSSHIAAMLAAFELFRNQTANQTAMTLAILFHDIIYDPKRNDNEAASAEFAKVLLTKLALPPQHLTKTLALICATQHGASQPNACDADCELLLDLDLAILGSSAVDYHEYSKAIRREYSHVPDELYRPGRARVLQAFLEQPVIYRTVEFRGRYEAKARANLVEEIANCRAQ